MREVWVAMVVAGCGRINFGDVPDARDADAPPDPLVPLVSTIAAGSGHACAIRGGEVFCWGNNESGQLGRGTITPLELPDRVVGIDDAIAIAIGWQHSCATRADESVWCWGANDMGQLGDGTMTWSSVPVPSLVTGARAIAGDVYMTCALTSSELWCWGNVPTNGTGTCDSMTGGSATIKRTPVLIGAETATWLSNSGSHVCAGDSAGVACFGHNVCDQLGDGSLTFQSMLVTAAGVTNVTSVATGLTHTCTTHGDQTVTCFGWNSWGQLAAEPPSSGPHAPGSATLLGSALEVVAGNQHTCVRTPQATVRCAGRNFNGAVGNGTTQNVYTVNDVAGVDGVARLFASTYSTFALRSNGEILGWGYGLSGQLGGSASSGVPVLIQLPP